MTRDAQSLALCRSSARDFLYCKPDIRHATRNVVFPDPQFCARIEQLPDFLVGSAFVTRATALLDTLPAFATVVVRIDDARPESGDEPEAGPSHLALAEQLARRADETGGLCGWLDRDLFGWILPEADGPQALEQVHALQAAFAESRPEPVSAGVAVFPCLLFSRSQILENARKALDHAAFFGPGQCALFDDVTLNISGDQRYQHGDINGAMEEFKKALALNADNVNVHNSLGVCYGVLGAYEAALRCFREALERAEGDVVALYNTGLTYLMIGDHDQALNCLLMANRDGDPIFEVQFQTGRLYMQRGAPAEARAFLESATRLNPRSGSAWRLLGECLAALDDVAEAVSAYKRAVKLNPGDAEALSALGWLFDRQGENPEITTIFCEQAVDIAPDNGLFHHRLGMLYRKQQRLDDAAAAFRRASEKGYAAGAEIETIGYDRIEENS